MGSYQNDSCRSERLEGIQNILDGKYDICRGLEYLCEALRELRCGREYEAEINVVNGIHHIKEGLCQIRIGLQTSRRIISCESRREIKNGIREICKALSELCEVLKEICCGCREDAEERLVHAICRVKKGLACIEKGLEDLYLCD